MRFSPPSRRSIAHANTRDRILAAHMLILTLQCIAALLLALMLLWHISTLTMVGHYQMPPWWEARFVGELASGWRVGVWVCVGVGVLGDCGVALGCVEAWWCVLRWQEDGFCCVEEEDAGGTNPVRSGQARLHRRVSAQTQRALLTVFDLAILAVLASHIVSYFVSIPRYLAYCAEDYVRAIPPLGFGTAGHVLSARDRCLGLNVDIHVAGGFSTFMAIVLSVLHCAALVVRSWEWAGLCGEGLTTRHESSREKTFGASNTAASTLRSRSTPSFRARLKTSDHHGSTAAATPPHTWKSASAEEHSTGIRFINRSAELAEYAARRRERRAGASATSEEGSRWSEVLLECLTDA